jgi:WD40 repeat protein
MNLSSPQLRWQLTFEGAWPTAVAFLGSARRLAAANEAGQIFVWDLPETPPSSDGERKEGRGAREAPDCPPVRRLDGHTNGVARLVATGDGSELISAGLDRTLRIWRPDDPPSGSAEAVLDVESRKAEAKRTRKDEVLTVPGVTVETLAAAQVMEGHADWVQALGISRDGRRLISGDASSRVIVWDLAERREIARWSGLPWNWVAAAALSPDGETALVSEYRYKRDDFDIPAPAVRFFRASTGEEQLDVLKTLFPKYKADETSYGSAQVWRKFIAQGLVAADFSPDGTLVALGQGGETDTGKVHLIEAATGKQLREVSGHQYGVTDVRFSADGQYLLSTGRDTMLRICQVSDGKEVAALGKSRGGQFKDWLSSLAISPDETMLAAADIAGLVHVWELT